MVGTCTVVMRVMNFVRTFLINNTLLLGHASMKLFSPGVSVASFPGLPRLCFLVCVQYNTRKRKSAFASASACYTERKPKNTEWGRLGNEASVSELQHTKVKVVTTITLDVTTTPVLEETLSFQPLLYILEREQP